MSVVRAFLALLSIPFVMLGVAAGWLWQAFWIGFEGGIDIRNRQAHDSAERFWKQQR